VQALANYQRSLQLNPNQPQLASRVGAISTPVAPLAVPPGTVPNSAPRWVAAPQGAVR
jgi:hypothetical protein